jgi:hypothetical protein
MLAGKMVSPEEQPMESNPAVPPQSQGGGRRRGRRGGRGRGRGRNQRHSPSITSTEQAAGTPAGEPAVSAPETSATAPSGKGASPSGKDASAISEAVEEVRQIVESLERALEQMEEVQELIDLADRQKSADEREIESLRRALRRIQPPRGYKDATHEHGSD